MNLQIPVLFSALSVCSLSFGESLFWKGIGAKGPISSTERLGIESIFGSDVEATTFVGVLADEARVVTETGADLNRFSQPAKVALGSAGSLVVRARVLFSRRKSEAEGERAEEDALFIVSPKGHIRIITRASSAKDFLGETYWNWVAERLWLDDVRQWEAGLFFSVVDRSSFSVVNQDLLRIDLGQLSQDGSGFSLGEILSQQFTEHLQQIGFNSTKSHAEIALIRETREGLAKWISGNVIDGYSIGQNFLQTIYQSLVRGKLNEFGAESGMYRPIDESYLLRALSFQFRDDFFVRFYKSKDKREIALVLPRKFEKHGLPTIFFRNSSAETFVGLPVAIDDGGGSHFFVDENGQLTTFDTSWADSRMRLTLHGKNRLFFKIGSMVKTHRIAEVFSLVGSMPGDLKTRLADGPRMAQQSSESKRPLLPAQAKAVIRLKDEGVYILFVAANQASVVTGSEASPELVDQIFARPRSDNSELLRQIDDLSTGRIFAVRVNRGGMVEEVRNLGTTTRSHFDQNADLNGRPSGWLTYSGRKTTGSPEIKWDHHRGSGAETTFEIGGKHYAGRIIVPPAFSDSWVPMGRSDRGPKTIRCDRVVLYK